MMAWLLRLPGGGVSGAGRCCGLAAYRPVCMIVKSFPLHERETLHDHANAGRAGGRPGG
jgi:hypothetical protein